MPAVSPLQTLLAQGEAIDALNARYESAFILLHGVEADILPEGEIDYDEAIWQKLDYLVASVHEKLQMDRAEATARLLRAVANPYVRVLGHWTGRLLRGRHGYPIDEEAILDACAAHNVAIEFNGNPHRMEIDWRWVRRAAEKGISIVLTTDAHSTRELQYLPYALPVLQKGLLPPHLFLNYQGPEVFKTKSKRV
jgi:DNA polymerase (family 10)